MDKGLEFTIGEMSSGDLGPLADNRLFRGGEVRMYRMCRLSTASGIASRHSSSVDIARVHTRVFLFCVFLWKA